MGSLRDAFRAGYNPNTTPVRVETVTASPIAEGGSENAHPVASVFERIR